MIYLKASKKNTKKVLKSTISLKQFVRLNSYDVNKVYERHCKLGQGSFSTVFKATNKFTCQQVALKFITKNSINVDMISETVKIKEVAILRKLDHPNIIKCYEVFDYNDFIVISEELAENGTLLNHLRNQNCKLSEKSIGTFMEQILSALSYCHERKIVH